MTAIFPPVIRKFRLWRLLMLILLGLAEGSIAAPKEKSLVDFAISANKGTELQLEVRQTPMADVLKLITAKTQVPIHYSVLPEGLVTATCVGSTLKQVLECLLDRKADLIVRYQQLPNVPEGKGQLAEAWVLGSQVGGTIAKLDCSPADTPSTPLAQAQSQQTTNTTAKPSTSDTLLKIAQTKNDPARAQAIGALLGLGNKDDPKIQEMLGNAIHDEDANIRTQAISTLAHLGTNPENIKAALSEAIHDDSADVRLMAVDSITDDVELLELAVNDSD